MKKRQSLWRVSVTTTPEAEDAVSEMVAALFDLPATAYHDLETGVSTVSVFSDQKVELRKTRAEITAGVRNLADCDLPVGSGRVEILRVKREDWAESWKRHFHPIEILLSPKFLRQFQPGPVSPNKTGTRGTRPSGPSDPSGRCGKSLLIKPSWSKQRIRKNQALVILDPGLSFGTGQHPTTSFCLTALVHVYKNGTRQSFLDIGTGSGILAIAAVKLGYQPVQAFDFDPESVRVARANARKNRVETRLRPVRSDITKMPVKAARKYDLVCANLISTLLISEKRRIVSRLKPGGILVLAGILAAEFEGVEREFAGLGLKRIASQAQNEWCSGAFCFI